MKEPLSQLVVALDVPSGAEALVLARQLQPLPLWLKIGLELFTAEGPELIRQLREMRRHIFLDLKFHDIPNTVKGAVQSATRLGVQMMTLHLAGGEAMARAALAGRDEAVRCHPDLPAPLLLGITVLTSDNSMSQEETEACVLARACQAKEWGLDGIVCSGLEARAVKHACGADFICLCPGIRFASQTASDDQARVTTPADAVAAGADFLVMGRPIIKVSFPEQSARDALLQMGYTGL